MVRKKIPFVAGGILCLGLVLWISLFLFYNRPVSIDEVAATIEKVNQRYGCSYYLPVQGELEAAGLPALDEEKLNSMTYRELKTFERQLTEAQSISR